MRVAMWIVFAGAGVAFASEPAGQDPTGDDAAKLQGTWSIVSVEIEGQPLVMEKLDDARLTVAGQRYSFKLDGIQLEFTVRMHASTTPMAIDLTITQGVDKGKTFHGIYKLDQDRYTICRTTEPEQPRPTTFASRPDSGLMMVVWKRAPASAAK